MFHSFRGFRLAREDGTEFQWFMQAMEAGAWEPHSFVLLDQYLKSGKVFVDIGAWIGPLTLYACTKPNVRVLALEPDKVVVARLRTNISLNSHIGAAEKITLEEACLATADGSVAFSPNVECPGQGMSRMGSGSEVAAAVTPTTLFAKHGLTVGDVCLFKMDIEGAEEDVLPALMGSLPPGPLPPLYLSLHGPNYTHPDSIDRIAATLFFRYDSVTCVENGQQLHSAMETAVLLAVHPFASVLCLPPRPVYAPPVPLPGVEPSVADILKSLAGLPLPSFVAGPTPELLVDAPRDSADEGLAVLAVLRNTARVMVQDLADKLQLATHMLTGTNNAAEIRDVCGVITAIATAIASMQRLALVKH